MPEWGRVVEGWGFFTVVFTRRVLTGKYYGNSSKCS